MSNSRCFIALTSSLVIVQELELRHAVSSASLATACLQLYPVVWTRSVESVGDAIQWVYPYQAAQATAAAMAKLNSLPTKLPKTDPTHALVDFIERQKHRFVQCHEEILIGTWVRHAVLAHAGIRTHGYSLAATFYDGHRHTHRVFMQASRRY